MYNINMNSELPQQRNRPLDAETTLRTCLDAIPALVFVVDADVRILDYNRAASSILGPSPEVFLRKRGGDVLHCIYAQSAPDACGRTDFCPDCVIRNAVASAMSSAKVHREVATMAVSEGEKLRTVCFLVTATIFTPMGPSSVLLILEDATELFELRRMLPICSHCGNVRDDERLWQNIRTYLKKHESFTFNHSLCPECIRLLYPNEAQKIIDLLNSPDTSKPDR